MTYPADLPPLTSLLVLARGLTVGADCAPWVNDHVRPYWLGCGQVLDGFNARLVQDERVEVMILPVFDGISQIRWRDA